MERSVEPDMESSAHASPVIFEMQPASMESGFAEERWTSLRTGEVHVVVNDNFFNTDFKK